MKNYLTPETMEIFDKAIKDAIIKIQTSKLSYEDWNSYYNLLIKSLYMQIPTVNYYEFASSLETATVMFKTEEEEKKYNAKLKQLKKNISFAEQLSKNSDMAIDFGLFNVISLDEAIRELSAFIERDREARKLAYIGKDGKDYYDLESLSQANANFMKYRNPPIEKSYINNNIEIIDDFKKPRR